MGRQVSRSPELTLQIVPEPGAAHASSGGAQGKGWIVGNGRRLGGENGAERRSSGRGFSMQDGVGGAGPVALGEVEAPLCDG